MGLAGRNTRSRRTFLRLGASSAALVALSGLPQGWRLPFLVGNTAVASTTTGSWTDPPVRRSTNGVLETQLHASRSMVYVAGRPVLATVYEGSLPAPTLRVRVGERLDVTLFNDLAQPTNLHFHGSHVSPGGNADNIFIHLNPGESFRYQYDLPADQAPGLHWYHPHAHGTNEEQVFGGLAGPIIVEGAIDDLQGIAGLQERLLFLQRIVPGADGQTTDVNDERTSEARGPVGYRLISGQYQPTLAIRPGETQRWRIANASANNFFRLSLQGHQFHLIARDGNPMSQVQTVDELIMAPGQRREVLVQGGALGTYELKTLPFKWGFGTEPEVLLGYLKTEGDAVPSQPLPAALIPSLDLRDAPVDTKREFRLDIQQTLDPREPLFLVDGKGFDDGRTDIVGYLDTTEEWTIHNDSDDWHPFHIHINPFQTVAVNGVPVDNFGLEDTSLVPPNGGSLTIRTQFKDFTGAFVWHCHILRHEERGMMQVVQVINQGDTPEPPPSGHGSPHHQIPGREGDDRRGYEFVCPI
jgi:FtsP/CotA-like multicopper oxidase with cupredoxin domain